MRFTVYKQRNRIHETIIIFDKRQFFLGGELLLILKISFSNFLTGSIKQQLRKEEK